MPINEQIALAVKMASILQSRGLTMRAADWLNYALALTSKGSGYNYGKTS